MKCLLNQSFVAVLVLVQISSSGAFAQQMDLFTPTPEHEKLGTPATAQVQIPFNFEEAEANSKAASIIDTNDEGRVEMSPAEIRKQEKEFHKMMVGMELDQRGKPIQRIARQFPTVKRWGIETGYFQILFGATAAYETWSRGSLFAGGSGIDAYGKSPVAYEQLIKSLEDPVASLSFYSFMVANGVAGDWLMDPRIPFRQKVVYAKGLVPGLAMTAGSMVSQVMGEFAQTMKVCYYDTIKKGEERRALGLPAEAPKKKAALVNPYEEGEKDPCEEAWRQWTVEKKFYAYAPAITSMLLATGVGAALKMTALKIFKRKATEGVEAGLEKAAQKVAADVTKGAVLTGLDWIVTFGRGKIVTSTLRFTGKLAGIGIFLGSDHLFKDGITWTYGNFFRSGDRGLISKILPGKNFDDLGRDLYGLMKAPKNDAWNVSAEKYLTDLSDEMDQWRKMNNQDAEAAHGLWLEKINGFTVSSRMAKNYYGQVLEDLKKHYINTFAPPDENAPPPALVWDWSKRVFPLYGIRPTAPAGVYVNADDYTNDYMLNPDRMEKFQLVTLNSTVPTLCEKFETPDKGFNANDLKFLTETCPLLKSGDRMKIGAGLTKLRNAINVDQRKSRDEQIFVSTRLFMAIQKFRSALGAPYPLMNRLEGFAYAFDANVLVRTNAEAFPRVEMGRFSKEKISDYMAFKMVCGAESPSQIITDRSGFSLQFNPPKIVSVKRPVDFCDNDRALGSLNYYRSPLIYSEKISTEKGVYLGVGNLIFDNLTSEIQAVVQNTTDEDNFNKYWDEKYGALITRTFEGLEKEYVLVQRQLVNNLSQNDSIFNKGIIGNSLIQSLQQETRTNLMVLGELLKVLIKEQPAVKTEVGFYASDDRVTKINPNLGGVIENLRSQIMRFGPAALLRAQYEPMMEDPEVFFKAYSPIPGTHSLDGKMLLAKPKIFQFQSRVESMLEFQSSYLMSLQTIATSPKTLTYVNAMDPQKASEFMAQVKALSNEKQGLPEYFHRFKLTPAQEKLMKTAVLNLTKALNTTNTYIMMAEAVRYDSNLREDNKVQSAPTGAGKGTIYRPN